MPKLLVDENYIGQCKRTCKLRDVTSRVSSVVLLDDPLLEELRYS
jgi:hypothetical protein